MFERRRQRDQGRRELVEILSNRDLATRVKAPGIQLKPIDDFLVDLHGRVGRSISAAITISGQVPTLRDIAGKTQSLGQELSQASEVIASSCEEVTTTLENELVPGASDMSSLSHEVAQSLRHCQQESDTVLMHIGGIRQTEQQLNQAMGRLQSQLEQVVQVIGVIADISKRTNLLSLNAAIEAARAGVHGRGFAVVAEEVRRLAQHTTESTEQVASIVAQFRTEMEQLTVAGDQMQGAIGAGEQGIGQMRDDLIEVRDAMEQLDSQVSSIAEGTGQIGSAVNALNQDAQTVLSSAKVMQSQASSFNEMAKALHHMSDELLEGGLGGFKLTLHNDACAAVERIASQPGLLSASTDELNQTLQQTLQNDSRFELLYLVGADGKQLSDNIFAADLANSDGHQARGKDWSSRHWFQAVVRERKAYVSDVYRSAATAMFCFTVAVPIYDVNAKLVRILGADVRLSTLTG